MALDSGAGSTTTLTNREAALLYGQGWECSETGARVHQTLTLTATVGAVLTGENETLARATRVLRRRRLEVQFGLEQLHARLASLRAFPLMRLAARKQFAALQAELAVHEQMLKELPQRPIVEKLDPEADSGLPANALKLGASLWFVNRGTQALFSCEITAVAIEMLEGPTLVYETRGAEADGAALRRTVAHLRHGLKTLSAPETAFMDPLSAREFLKRIAPATVEQIAPAKAETVAPWKPEPAASAKAGAMVPPRVAPASTRVEVLAAAPSGEALARHAAAPVDPDLHDIALEPFDESLLK